MKKWIITLIALVFLYMILVGQSSAYLDGWQAAYFGVQTQNSQYFNTYVVKKEEVGWFQIKPMTAYITTKEIWKEMDKKEALFLIKRKLMDNPKFVMVIVGKLLEKYPTFMEALAEGYNKGQHKHLYAKSVLSKYYKLRQKVEED